MNPGLLHVSISADYSGKAGVLRDVSLEIRESEIVGLLGRSGEGKSTIASAILGLLAFKGGTCRGEIRFRGRNLLNLSGRQMREIRGKEIGFVPQSPLQALNPNLRLGDQLEEAWRAHRSGKPEWKALLESVSLPPESSFLRQHPRQLSVGLAQRFLIAMAILHRPPLLIADEPTSALDMITQAEILDLFGRLNREQGIAILYISHDLASVASLCDSVSILYQGEIVERGPTAQIFRNPQHPFTRKMIAALPQLQGGADHDPVLLKD